jgi:hypothetical protein
MAEERIVLLLHARKKVNEWLEAQRRAGRDALYDEPKTDPSSDRIRDELVEIGKDVRLALGEANRPTFFSTPKVLGGMDLLSKYQFDHQPSSVQNVIPILDDAIVFYKGIVEAPRPSRMEASTMNDRQARLDEKDAQRLRLLDAIYELTDGESRDRTTHVEAFERAGLDEDDGESATHYLFQAGLLDRTDGYVGLTPSGVDERERAIRDQGARTEHFSATAVKNVYNIHGPVGVLQTGNHSTAANVTQRTSSGIDAISLSALLKDLHAEAQALPAADRDEAVALAKQIEVNATGDRFDPDRLKKYLDLYATVVTVVSPTLRSLIQHFLPQIPALADLLR